MKTAEGSPSRLARVRSSYVGFLTAPSTWSTTTRTSDIRRSSDELLGREELGQRLGARAVLVLDDLAGGARRAGRGVDDLGGGVAVALDADLVALELDDRGQRDLRQAEALGEHRRDDAHARVGRRQAPDDQ